MNIFGIALMLLCAGFCIVASWRHQAWKYEKSRAASLRREVARHERGAR